jgi:hypothetical protein
MLRLLASSLLKKTMPAARKAARKRGNVNLIGEPKRDGISREIVPADGSNSAQHD